MSKLRIGIIGGGGIAKVHLPRLRERSDAVELAALADINPSTGQRLAGEFGIARFVSDYHELLPLVDAVLICVPTHLHAPIAIDALRAGKAVFCEKPLARTMQQALDIAKRAKEPSRFQVGFVRRFDQQWLALRDAVRLKRIGGPVVWRDIQSSPGINVPWFCCDEHGGGPFLDGCIHNYDFALHTFGPAEWVFAHLRTINPKNTAFDTGTATVRFESGDELVLTWSWGLPEGSGHFRRMDFLGPQGSLTIADDGTLLINRGGGSEVETIHVPKDSLKIGFADQMDEFIEVARGHRPPRVGIADGVASLGLALAILESGRRSGEKIFMRDCE